MVSGWQALAASAMAAASKGSEVHPLSSASCSTIIFLASSACPAPIRAKKRLSSLSNAMASPKLHLTSRRLAQIFHRSDSEIAASPFHDRRRVR